MRTRVSYDGGIYVYQGEGDPYEIVSFYMSAAGQWHTAFFRITKINDYIPASIWRTHGRI